MSAATTVGVRRVPRALLHAFLITIAIAWLIPIGGATMIVHTLLHMILDVDYILRRKTPPERMRSGH